jgi:hypothetical protein
MTTIDDLAARIDALTAGLQAQGLAVPEPLVGGTLPPHVASGELITSAWGNAVVDELTRSRTDTRAVAGAFQGLAGTSGGGMTIADGLVPAQTVAGTLTVWSHTLVGFGGGTAYTLSLLTGATIMAQWICSVFTGVVMAEMHMTTSTSPGVAVQLIVSGSGTANVTTYVDPRSNRVDWLWLPNRNT